MNFHINFSNSDFSVDIASICAKFLGYVPPEERMSQNCVQYFCTILYHKNVTKT